MYLFDLALLILNACDLLSELCFMFYHGINDKKLFLSKDPVFENRNIDILLPNLCRK